MSVAKNLFLLLLACAMLFSCDRPGSASKAEASDDVKLVTQNDYSLLLPKYLSPTKSLHEEASLQYQNPVKEVYVIVIDELKAGLDSALVENGLTETYPANFDGYSKMIRDQFMERVEIKGDEPTLNPLKTNGGLEMKYFEAEADVENMKIFYMFGMVAHDERYYQIVTWTMTSRREKYSPDMLSILKSFTAK